MSQTVVVIGAGTMGRGIARVAAESGYDVRLVDVSEPALSAAITDIEKGLARSVEKGKLGAEDARTARARLSTSTSAPESANGAAWVIEAVPEDPGIKASTYSSVRESIGPDTILATNTSSIPITKLAVHAADPSRFVGVHFFNPVPLMKLVEVVRGEKTSDSTVERSIEFALSLGKTPIVVKDSPGFATSRLGVLLGLEAMRMVESGVASAEDIDRAMELGYNHPVGPLRLTDLVGLDVRLGIAESLHRELGAEAFRPPEILRKMVAGGLLGKKSGQGFYRWETR